nr:hypothetical protein [uncultured Oscillibacter sp.]
MRKKLAAFLLCALLVFQMAVPPARAANTVYFVVAGVEVQPISDQTMPFWSGGYLYIPASLFTGAARKTLGISCVSSSQTVILYSGGDHSLIFDLNESFTQDSEGNISYPGAIQRGGVTFVPAFLVAKYFNLVYSVTDVRKANLPAGLDSGYLVWLRQPSFDASLGLTPEEFADASSYSMAGRYAEYRKAKEQAAAPPEEETEEEAETPETVSGKGIYLCLEADETASAVLDALDTYQVQAAFFCSVDFLRDHGDLLRRMTATGQTIGLVADAGKADQSVAEQLEEGNRLLELATCGKTRFAWVRNGTDSDTRAAEEDGYRCLKPDLDRSGYELRSTSQANSLLQKISAQKDDVTVWLGSHVSAVGLRAFLLAARNAEDNCLALTELA